MSHRDSLKAPRVGLIKSRRPRDDALAEFEEPDSAASVQMAFPPEVLKALRFALEAGLTGEQVVSFLMLAASLKGVQEELGGEELIERTCYITTVIKGDMENTAKAVAWMERVQKREEERRGKRKRRGSPAPVEIRGPRVWTAERDELVSRLYGEGLSQRDVAVRLKTCTKQVSASLRRTATPIRGSPPNPP